jgi:hypothetical protein
MWRPVRRLRTIRSLQELAPQAILAVIVNCGTKTVTTLALASALRRMPYPVLLIDCESGDGSAAHFARLAPRLERDFTWLSWPLRRHGLTLDALCAAAPAESILLIDSDLEILDARVVSAMQSALAQDTTAYGAGFLHRQSWLGAQHGVAERVGRYAERMWIPLTLLRLAPVQEQLHRGVSFAQRRDFLEFPGHPRLSQWLGYRYWLPGLRSLWPPASARASDTAEQPLPAFVEHDTGARMHHALTQSGHPFAALDVGLWGDVRHLHGVTRAGVSGRLHRLARRIGLLSGAPGRAQESAAAAVRERLRDEYGITI